MGSIWLGVAQKGTPQNCQMFESGQMVILRLCDGVESSKIAANSANLVSRRVVGGAYKFCLFCCRTWTEDDAVRV